MDAVKQPHRILGLVRLQLADHVQPHIGEAVAQRRPLALGFLHAVLPEVPLAGRYQWHDGLRAVRLGDGNQCDVCRVAPCVGSRARDLRPHLGKPRGGGAIIIKPCCIAHARGL